MSSLEDFYQGLDARMALPDNEACHEFSRKAKYIIIPTRFQRLWVSSSQQNRSVYYDQRWRHHVHVYAPPNADQNPLSLILSSIYPLQDIEPGV